MARYANPEVLVDTDWVNSNLTKPGIKLVEIDVDTKQYDAGHIPGAVGFNWQTQLQDQLRRDIISQEAFEKLAADDWRMESFGRTPGAVGFLGGEHG